MAITSEQVNLSTNIDEYAAELFIQRKENESLSDFEERVILGYKNLYNTGPEAFKKSLDYITDRRNKEVCKINILLDENGDILLEECEIEIKDDVLSIKVDDIIYSYDFNDYKFLYQLIKELKENPNIEILLGEFYEEIEFERTKNILSCNSKKKILNFESSEALIKLPVKDIIRVLNQTTMEIIPISPGDTEIENPERNFLKLLIEYNEMPISLEWNHFKILECNGDVFKSMLRDADGFLTSHGAKLINQILEKQNTYWG